MTDRRPKVLFLCSWFRESPDSPAGVFFAEQAAALAEQGHEVAIACCSSIRSLRECRSMTFFSISRDEHYAGSVRGNVYRGEIGAVPPRFGRLNDFLRRWQFARFLKRVFADFGRPDVVHIQSTIDAGILAFEHLVSMKIPYVITEHGSFFRRHMVPDWKLPLVKKCFGNACASFAVSNSLIADLQTIGVEAKIGIMPNTYDSELFNIEGAQRSEIFTFVMVCALHESLKGVDIAVEAFAKLLQHHDDCRLIIAGAGPDAVQIDQRIDRLGIASNTKTIGPQSRADVARLMKKSHCIVSASRVETFGVTLIEGLACGLAAVATRSGGPEDFIVAPHGVLVPVNDPERLAIAMRDTLENYDSSADARVARNEYVTRNYSKQAFYSRIAPVYDRVCACGKPGAAAGSSSN